MEQMSESRSSTASSVTCEDTCGIAKENVDPKRRVKRHTAVINIIIIRLFFNFTVASKVYGPAFELEIKMNNSFSYIH